MTKSNAGDGINTNKASDLVDVRRGTKDSALSGKQTTPTEQTKKTVFVRDPAAVERFKQGKD